MSARFEHGFSFSCSKWLTTVCRQAKSLQSGLLALIDRVDKVKEEHDKLEGENRFLQEYVHNLL